MEKLPLHSYAYLMNESFNRICDGKNYSLSFEPYTEDFIAKMISFFEREEEYEKCEKLFLFKSKRFNHEENYHCF
jgi:hypothetical protein